MSTTLKRKLSVNEAARLASSVLELSDARKLGIALAEAAAEESIRNRGFAERVRMLYREVPDVTPRSGDAAGFTSDLVPIKRIEGRELDPTAPLDPYFLLEAFGPHQLEKALKGYPLFRLKEGAAAVEANHPGTKPKNRGQKASVIAYIVEQLTTN